MIDLQSVIREQLFYNNYRITFDQIIQNIRYGILKGNSERYIETKLHDQYLKLNSPKMFEKWRLDRISNYKLGYGIVFETEIEIQTYIFEILMESIQNMEDIKLFFSFQNGLIIQSPKYNPAFGMKNCIDFRYLYPTVYINSEYEKKIRIKENNVNFGVSQT